VLLLSNLLKSLLYSADKCHKAIDHQHFLDLLTISNNMLLLSNLLKSLLHSADTSHNAIDLQHFLEIICCSFQIHMTGSATILQLGPTLPLEFGNLNGLEVYDRAGEIKAHAGTDRVCEGAGPCPRTAQASANREGSKVTTRVAVAACNTGRSTNPAAHSEIHTDEEVAIFHTTPIGSADEICRSGKRPGRA
jgi:hypothetical protein